MEPWPKLFHALRASCETDLAAEHPIGAVCKWIGNTRAIAARHYLVARDEDFERAIRGGAKSGALMAPDCAQRPPAPGCGNAQESPEPLDSCSVMQPGASRKSLLQNDLMEDSGLERDDVTTDDTTGCVERRRAGGAGSCALRNETPTVAGETGPGDDAALAIVVAAWPDLPESARRQILGIVRLAAQSGERWGG